MRLHLQVRVLAFVRDFSLSFVASDASNVYFSAPSYVPLPGTHSRRPGEPELWAVHVTMFGSHHLFMYHDGALCIWSGHARDSFPAVVSVLKTSLYRCYGMLRAWGAIVGRPAHSIITYVHICICFGTISYAVIVTGFVPTLYYYLQILIADLIECGSTACRAKTVLMKIHVSYACRLRDSEEATYTTMHL